jgi:Zn-dependent protease with chaperone function
MDINRFKFAFILTGLPVFVMIVSFIAGVVLSKKQQKLDSFKQFKSSFDWVNFSLLSAALFILNFAFFPLLQASEKSEIESTSIAVAFVILLVSLGPILFPLIVLLRSKKYESNHDLERMVNVEMNTDVKIRIINQNLINAFATGVLPFSKIILLGAPLFKQFTKDELKAIIAHEIGHTRKHHLLYLTLIMILIQISLLILHQFFILPLISLYGLGWVYKGISIGILFVLGNEVFSYFQRKTEYSADKFAAEAVGKTNYANVLRKLDEVTGGKLQSKTATHPTLNERLNHIEISIKDV